VPRLGCTFREFIEIITANGFVLHRHGATSHRRYRGVIDGEVRFVDVAFHSISDDVRPGTLNAMIRQSALPKSLFMK
jgi:predicted RNA binding protein YcfA (HicA-like mRNA interferase family)